MAVGGRITKSNHNSAYENNDTVEWGRFGASCASAALCCVRGAWLKLSPPGLLGAPKEAFKTMLDASWRADFVVTMLQDGKWL